jgi:hypothetical protein
VRKIVQKQSIRNGKRKYTMQKAERTEIAILPSAMPSAMISELSIMVATGPAPAASRPPPSTVA